MRSPNHIQEVMTAIAGRKAALQFSGGKDSLALLYLLRPLVVAGLPVYWTHTGDTISETLEIVEEVRGWIPDFRTIEADVIAWKSKNGIPSDVTTAQSSPIGNVHGLSGVRLVGRFDCCVANLMLPMHKRMLADGIEVVIRGTKLADTGAIPSTGDPGAYDLVLPLRDWSHTEVFEYLQEVGAPINRVYEHFKAISAPECTHCSAWWDDGKASYLKALHPETLPGYHLTLQTIRAELQRRMQELESEIQECEK